MCVKKNKIEEPHLELYRRLCSPGTPFGGEIQNKPNSYKPTANCTGLSAVLLQGHCARRSAATTLNHHPAPWDLPGHPSLKPFSLILPG